jgi:Protein of unknown function (DUF998)
MTESTTTAATATTTVTTSGTSVRVRLACGILAGPLFLAVSYAQAATRDGFDLTRNAFSYLSLGPGGGLQMANFVLCGLLFIAAATAIRQILRGGPGHKWAARLIATMGAAMTAGGIFRLDPAYGYPPGSPTGQPDTLSWHGLLHAIAFTVAIVSWLAACFVFAARFLTQQRRGWATYSATVGLALLTPIATFVTPPGAPIIYAAATLGWTWTSAVITHLLRHTAT